MTKRSLAFATAASAAVFAFSASEASAQSTSAERTILGWSSTGKEVVVKLVQRGERMVDGVSKDYYFEALEVYSARDGTLAQRYKAGEAVGDPPEEFTEAKPEDVGAKFLETVGLVPAARGWESPGGDYRLTSLLIEETAAQDGKYRCVIQHQLAILEGGAARWATLSNTKFEGESAARRDDVRCPDARVEPAWSPDGKQWALLVRSDDQSRLATGSLVTLGAAETAAVERTTPLLAELRPEGPMRTAWTALSRGQYEAAASAFETVELSEGALGRALVEAFRGDKGARKAADKAYKASDQTGWDRALRAATYLMAGDSKKGAKMLDDALKKAASYEELLRMAALYELVDVGVANQVAVHALSHPTAAQADTTAGWNLLGRGLLDVNEFSKADEALSKIAAPNRATRVIQARLALDRGQRAAAANLVRELVREEPSNCTSLLLKGRVRALDGQNLHARQLFEAAAYCDPYLEEALYYAADFSRLAGDVAAAKAGYERYLSAAIPRRSDPIRAARRNAASQWVKRLGHQGVVLVQSSCRRIDTGYLCTGVVSNTGAEPATEVKVEARHKKKALGSATVSVEPGATAPFGVRFEAKSLADVVLRAGRDAKEQTLNETPAR